MPPREVVIQQLTNLANRQIDNFNQGDEHRAWQAGTAMAHGYCHGICLDWVRRVLQGGRASYGPNPQRAAEEAYDFNTRRQQQANRQGNAWDQFYAIRRDVRAVNSANYNAAHADYSAEVNSLNTLIGGLVPLYNANRQLGNTSPVTLTGALATSLRTYYEWTGAGNQLQVGLLGDMIDGLSARRAGLQAPQPTAAAAANQRVWTRFTVRMDGLYPKGRTFQNIELAHLNSATTFNSLEAAITSVTDPALNSYQNGMAMVIGIDMIATDGSDTGHAVAMYWQAQNTHIFLDPNYGMFEFDSMHAGRCVRDALRYLFQTVYPAYESVRQVRNSIDYSTYRRAPQ